MRILQGKGDKAEKGIRRRLVEITWNHAGRAPRPAPVSSAGTCGSSGGRNVTP